MVQIVHFIVVVLVGVFFIGCREDDGEGSNCPPFDIIPASPYQDPVWHPNGELIGFNHTPLQEITYTYGFDCPHQATYTYKEDSAGFWFVTKSGTNKRRVLSYYLRSASWSPDGNWIAFMDGSQIFKMAFDGTKFDETTKVQLTAEGRNFFPAWSPNGEILAYDNTDCGSATTPPPPNSCGVLTIEAEGTNRKFIGEGRMPYWGHDDQFIYIHGDRYNLATAQRVKIFDPITLNISINRPPAFNPVSEQIAFIGKYTSTSDQHLTIFIVNSNGTNLKTIGDLRATALSWSPDGHIVYLNYDESRINETNGTLSITDSQGNNKKQLTFNKFTTR